MAKAAVLLKRAVEAELSFCFHINRACRYRLIKRFFSAISRLGDGVFWYTLMLVLPIVYGIQALHVSLQMFTVGLVGLLIYKVLKKLTSRERPYNASDDIKLGTRALDHYSFPSGHTLHAVAFSLVVTHYYAEPAWIVLPFAVLVAMSRVILGLHYPTDVVAGALIGTTTAMSGLALFNL